MLTCIACGKRLGREARFCSRCGAARPVARPEAARRGGGPAMERRHLTVLFCDLVGSTELSAALDPEDLADIIIAYRELMQARVAGAGGTVAQYMGDGLLAYFGYPNAHDDDAARGVGAALAMLAAAPELNRRFAHQLRSPLQIRIGVHSGLTLIELNDASGPGLASVGAIGQAPNIAARLQGLAEPGSCLVSAETRALSAAAFDYEPRGEVIPKGVAGPLLVFRPLGARRDRGDRLAGGASAGTAALDGHAKESDRLLRLWAETRAGRGAAVLLTGDPGIGKTFVANRLAEAVRGQGGTVLRFACQFDATHSPFRPVLVGLQRRLLLQQPSVPAEKVWRLQRALRRLGFEQPSLPALLCEFLGLPVPPDAARPPRLTPQGRRQLLRDMLLTELARQAARRRPVLVVIENAHWIDPSSEEWLTELVRRTAQRQGRLMTLVTARPGYEEAWVGSRLLDERIRLDRLDHASLERLFEALGGGRFVDAGLRRDLLERSDGVPLFLEELLKSATEGGSPPEWPADGAPVHGSGPGGATRGSAIPDALRGMLTARLDRLGTAKPIALAAAVIGRDFSLDLVHALRPARKRDIQPGTALLVGADIVRPQHERGADAYSFKHALLRDAAYDSLLTRSRRTYHARLAQAYLKGVPELVEERPEMVARHASLGGLTAEAVNLWTRAGSRALERSAYREAAAGFRRALADAEDLPTPLAPGAMARLCTQLATALIGAEGFAAPEVERLCQQAYRWCREGSDPSGLAAAVSGLTTYYQVRGPLSRARELAEGLVELARERDDAGMLVRAVRRLGWCRFCMGEVAAGRQVLAEVLERYGAMGRREGERLHASEIDAGVLGHVNLGWAESFAGNADAALARCRAGLDLAAALGERPADMAYALCMAAATHQVIGDHAATLAYAERARELAAANALPYWRAWSAVLLGWGLIPVDPRRAARTILGGLAAYRRTGARLFVPYNLDLAAQAFLALGRPRLGLGLVQRAALETTATEARFSEVGLLATRSRLLHALGRPDEAEADARRAAGLAESQGCQPRLPAPGFPPRPILGPPDRAIPVPRAPHPP